MCCAPGTRGWRPPRLLLDLLKGTIAVLIVYEVAKRYRWPSTPTSSPIVAGLGAFLGHLFPVWLGFQGGKGAATFIGVLLGVHWPAALVFGLVWIAGGRGLALFLAGHAERHRRA